MSESHKDYCDAVPVICRLCDIAFVQRIEQGNAMPDSKNLKWADGYATDANSVADEVEVKQGDAAVPTSEPAANDAQPAANDSDGWQQYRQWISKAPAPRGRRVGIDPALYSWKGLSGTGRNKFVATGILNPETIPSRILPQFKIRNEKRRRSVGVFFGLCRDFAV